jgi:hypothetical protein
MSKTNTDENKSIVPKLPRILLTIPAVLLLVIGLSGENGPFGPGSVIDAFMSAQATDEALQLRMQGTAVLGMVLFSLFITHGGFRFGQRWAWYALWYWPLFFILHIVAFGTWIPDLPLAILSVIALILPYKLFFSKKSST